MQDFYHYTLGRHLPAIQRSGIFSNHPYFTTTEYHDALVQAMRLA
jgi:hypothetical protein